MSTRVTHLWIDSLFNCGTWFHHFNSFINSFFLYCYLKGDYSLGGGLAEQSHTDFGSNKSDSTLFYEWIYDDEFHNQIWLVSAVSLTESDRRALAPDLRSSHTYSSHLGGGGGGVPSHTPRPHSQQGFRPTLVPVSATHSHALPPQQQHTTPFRAHSHLRRSLPNMSAAALAAQQSNEPAKIYPAHLLFTTNYRLPVDVNRCTLEVTWFVPPCSWICRKLVNKMNHLIHFSSATYRMKNLKTFSRWPDLNSTASPCGGAMKSRNASSSFNRATSQR